MPSTDQFREFAAAQAKATPGPWEDTTKANDDDGRGWYIVVDRPDGEEVCRVHTGEANAALIALARSLPVAEWIAERERMRELLADIVAAVHNDIDEPNLDGPWLPCGLVSRIFDELKQRKASQ